MVSLGNRRDLTQRDPAGSAISGTNALEKVGWNHIRNRVEAQRVRLKLFGKRIMSCDPDRQTAAIQIRIAIMNRCPALRRVETVA